jgi:hypothetical protein
MNSHHWVSLGKGSLRIQLTLNYVTDHQATLLYHSHTTLAYPKRRFVGCFLIVLHEKVQIHDSVLFVIKTLLA